MPEARDVRVDADDPGASESYLYVARRPHGVVALADARHMEEAFTRSLVEQLADELERCSASLESQGQLVEGAARVAVVSGPQGTPALAVRLSPGDDVAHNALLCFIAPIRAKRLPPRGPTTTPGLALEATWGPVRTPPSIAPTTSDAGAPP